MPRESSRTACAVISLIPSSGWFFLYVLASAAPTDIIYLATVRMSHVSFQLTLHIRMYEYVALRQIICACSIFHLREHVKLRGPVVRNVGGAKCQPLCNA